jgi:hypothetical protein
MTIRRRGPKLKEAPEGYARFTEAAKIFEPLTRNVFNYRVRAGDIIVREDEAGKMYEIASVIKTKNILLQDEEKKKVIPVNTIADWIKIDDVIAGLKLDQIVYNEHLDEFLLTNAAHYQERKRKNPYTSIGVFDAHDRGTMYAYISLLPLKEETIMDILLGKREETDIHSEDILTYDKPGEYTLLASSTVHHPDHPELINRLIRTFMQFWIEQYPERRIKRIYAQTVSDSGKLMANKLRMSTMYVMKDGHMERVENAYMLDLNEPAASKIIKEFQERLKEKSQ